ncbi:hypothetical protein DPMN_132961 [Dreissena polymorpha]|uniref:Uncharacterized protein n=1 Tax=Dreissena polymorpha TaxID=45954 RepID=A0A9D4FWZ0_DREPO|nr:hypothetical protein DPMN_132961 [Dreissena polymorpha]
MVSKIVVNVQSIVILFLLSGLIAFDTEYQYQDPEMFVSDHPMHRSSAPPQTQKKPGPSSVQPAHGFKSRAALRQTVSDTMDSRSTDPHRDVRSIIMQ